MTDETLLLADHQLSAAVVKHGSVEIWECRNCGRRAGDAFEYIGVACDSVADGAGTRPGVR